MKMACILPKQMLSAVIFGLTLFLLSIANVSLAKDVTLTWDASPSLETDVAGYKVYYGTSPGIYTGSEAAEGPSPVDSGNTTSKTFVGLDNTKSHYFTVTAYNFDGDESAYSNEVDSPAQSNDDSDGDGYAYSDDCDDYNAAINPGATEIPCDGIDQDCSGADTVNATCTDSDKDGISDNIDQCPDTAAGVTVDANGCEIIDETPVITDADEDGFDAISFGGKDCNDNKPTINPGATDICGDGIDQDCSGADAVCPADPIEILIPNGGEKWSSSSPQTTSWRVSDTPSLVDTVVIEYSKNDQSWKTLKTMSGKQAQATSTEVTFPLTRKSKDIKVKVTVKNAQGVVMGEKNSEYLTLTR